VAQRKIRADLDGVVTVHVGGYPQNLRAGDPVPRGVRVAPSLLADAEDDQAEPTPGERVAPLTDDERAAATSLGYGPIDEDDHPEFVRGFVVGARSVDVDAAVSAALDAQAADQPPPASVSTGDDATVHGQQVDTYDPADGSVDEVLAYLEANPDSAGAVLERERAGKARVGILESKFAGQG
jgi:hypothetical protein